MNKSKKLTQLFSVVVCLAVLLAACAPAATPAPIVATEKPAEAPAQPAAGLPDEIRIGWIDSMTGANAAGGEMDWKGAQYAHKLRPTVAGKPVKLVLVDDKSEKTESAAAAARLIEVEKSQFVIGSWSSSLALAAADVTEKAGIPFMTPTCTNPLITKGRPLNFRMAYVLTVEGAALAKFAVENLKAKTAVIIIDVQQDYSVAVADVIKNEFIRLTGDEKSILDVRSSQSGDKDFSAHLTAIKTQNPDVVFMTNYYVEVSLIIQQAASMAMGQSVGGKPYFIATANADVPEMVPLSGAAAEGLFFSTSYDPTAFTSQIAKDFQQGFKAEYNIDADWSAVSSFDSYNIVLDAIEKAGTVDGKTVAATLQAMKDWEGAAGLTTFDENNNPLKAVIIMTFKNGAKAVETTIR